MIFFRLFFGYLIQVIPFAFLGLFALKNLLRFSAKKTMILTGILLSVLDIAFSSISTYMHTIFPPTHQLFQVANGIFLICLIPCFIWLMYAVKTCWEIKLFDFSFMMTSALALNSICNVVISRYYPDGSYDGLPYTGYSSLIILLVTILILPLLVALIQRFYIPVSDSLSQKENRYLAILSLILFLFLASGLSFIDYENIYNPMSLFLYFALLISIFLIYTIYFHLLSLAHDKLLFEQNNQKLKHQLEIRDEQYCRFNDTIENTRRIRHDFKHHLLILYGLNHDGKSDEIEEYLNQYIQQFENYEIEKLCDNTTINWIVSYYRALAKEHNITFNTRISIPYGNLEVEDVDLSVLLGNLLENSIIAASQAETKNRFINFNIIYSGKMYAITVDNSFDGFVNMDSKQHYLSTKSNHNGIGLQSIRNIAQKYNGGVDFSHKDNIFYASVMIKI